MRQVLLYHMGSAVVAAGKAAKQLAAAVMPPRDRLALELGGAQSVPRRGRDVFFAECTRAWHVIQRRKPKAKAGHNGGAKVFVDCSPLCDQKAFLRLVETIVHLLEGPNPCSDLK